MAPERGSAAPTSIHVSAISVMMAPPINQEKIAAGPAIPAAVSTANSQPDPI
jgi:hypothetical protein